MLIALLVAMAKNRVIGRDGHLPWHLPEDLRRFKRLTMGQTLLMGRKTYLSIDRPLPGRQTIILSRDPDFTAEGCVVVASLEAGIAAVRTEQVFVCGGAAIYQQALPLVEKIYLTELLQDVAGDTFFPQLPEGQFQTLSVENLVDAGHNCRFSILQRNS